MVLHGSGDGFVTLEDGSLRWGRFGAAGLLIRHDGPAGSRFFVARRSHHTHQGGSWAIPGGALHRGEEPMAGALREFREEIGLEPALLEVEAVVEDDHGGWVYWTYLATVAEPFEPAGGLQWETAEVRWVTSEELGTLDLFGAFRSTLVRLGILVG